MLIACMCVCLCVCVRARMVGGCCAGPGQSVIVRELRQGRVSTIRGLPAADEAMLVNVTTFPKSSPSSPAFTVTGLSPLTLYQFRVRPINRIGGGQWSAPSPRIRTKAVGGTVSCSLGC